MSLHKLTAGDGYMYLIRQVAAADASERGRGSLSDYYTDKGESAGVWMGSGLAALGTPISRDTDDENIRRHWHVEHGSTVTEEQMKALFGEGLHPNADQITEYILGGKGGGAAALHAARLGRPFPIKDNDNPFKQRLRAAYRAHNIAAGNNPVAKLEDEVRATLRTAVAQEMFAETYNRPPADDREISGFIARNTRTATTAVAGFDLTFTPVKSVSTLWALAPEPIAQTIQDCHHQAVAETLVFLEEHVAFSRMGSGGIAQIKATGLIAAAFDHRDSRAGDPNLHTHLVISNKVHVIGPDGIPRWLALDGALLYRAKVAASEHYNTRIEALLIAKLGVRFVARATQRGKRAVREIANVSTKLTEFYSSRRAAVEHRFGELAKQFHTDHGREPTAVEALALSQQANLDTRQAKHEPRSLAEQRHTWRAQATEILGSQRAISDMVADATHSGPHIHPEVTEEWLHTQAAAVITTVAETRAAWTINHIRAEAQRHLRNADHPGGPELVDRIIATALSEHSIALSTHADAEMNVPSALRRPDGTSVYIRHDDTVYTSNAMLAAERRILAAATLTNGRRVDEDSVGLALLEAHANTGVALNDGQTALVKQMATSGARVQLALAPAGTGKTTAMAALAAAWRTSGGTVIGLAPTASAAEVLAEDLGTSTDTLAKFVQLAGTRSDQPQAPLDDPARKWFDTINDSSLLILDEAGMASTFDLDTLISHALARGASVRLIGDDQQLAAISAGGILRDLAQRHNAVTLNTVVRFTHAETGRAEAAASLAIREGDPAGIGFYIDHHRVHIGADATAEDMAYAAWAADRAAGRDSLLVAPTNDIVARLNQRARLDRLTAAGATTPTSTVTLADGLIASSGDTIATRENCRYLRTDNNGGWVKNGHRWTIRTVHDNGALTVVPLRGTATPVLLPPWYVSAFTTLGYANTINQVQGMTAGRRDTEGTCHTVIGDHLTRNQLYVALTRGCTENHLYGSTAEADPHRILTPKATHPATAVDVLSSIVRRDGAQQSAHTVMGAEADPFTRLHRAAQIYTDALTTAAARHAGPSVMAAIDDAAAKLDEDLTDAEAWPVLRRNLALLAIDGHDPVAALHHAAQAPLGEPHDVAAVLDYRLPTPPGSAAERVGPLRWLADIPTALADDPTWGAYLSRCAELVTELADEVRETVHSWTPETAPAWARPLLPDQGMLTAEIAVFRAAHNVDTADTRVTGPEHHRNRSAAFQRLLRKFLDASLTRPDAAAQRWRPLVDGINPQLCSDPFWPRLATHLDHAARAGADVAALLDEAVTANGPLPDEMPAAALWWRLAGTLAPPSLQRTDTTLRPEWAEELHHLLGTRIAEAVITDPAWPGLITAVASSGWPPADLLSAAAEHLRDSAATRPLRPDEYARLLTYRIGLLTHHAATLDSDIPHPAATFSEPQTGEQLDLFAPAIAHPADGLAEPPPDLYDYAYGFAEDDFAGLDFSDLSTQRPAVIAPFGDIDIPDLRARRDAAQHRAQQILLSGGPAEHALTDRLAELRCIQEHQRPFQHALAHAHKLWVDAEDTASLHNLLLTQVQASITAAHSRGNTDEAQRFQQHYDDFNQRTPHVRAAVEQARHRLNNAHTALLAAAGGTEGIVTERHIQTLRSQAMQADAQALSEARRHARELDNQLAQAEHIAARALAENPAYPQGLTTYMRQTIAGHNTAQDSIEDPANAYDLTAELNQLRDEIDYLTTASAVSPAALYYPPQTAAANLDNAHQRTLTAITSNIHTVQPLVIHPFANKTGLLAALADTAHHHDHRVLALPVTKAAAHYATNHRYADSTATPEQARTNLDSQRWKLPRGTLIVIDDADQLPAEQLRFLTHAAVTTNTKLILITTPGSHPQPAHTLLDVLTENLPHTHHIGTPTARTHARSRTAIVRLEHHLDTPDTSASPVHAEAAALLSDRTALLRRIHDIAATDGALDAIAKRHHGHDKQRDRSGGLHL
ncbi:MobF family relaxase [Mycobacterium sp. MS3]